AGRSTHRPRKGRQERAEPAERMAGPAPPRSAGTSTGRGRCADPANRRRLHTIRTFIHERIDPRPVRVPDVREAVQRTAESHKSRPRQVLLKTVPLQGAWKKTSKQR